MHVRFDYFYCLTSGVDCPEKNPTIIPPNRLHSSIVSLVACHVRSGWISICSGYCVSNAYV